MAYSETQLAHFRAGLRPGECGALVPEASPETMPPFSGAMSPTPESSLQVHRVTVTVFREVDDFPTVPRTTLVPRDHISKHVSHPHKGRV